MISIKMAGVSSRHFSFSGLGLFFLILSALCSSGCSTTYENTALKAWDTMASGQTSGAISAYEKDVTSNKDALLKHMDEGILYRVSGNWEESNREFFAAAKIIEANGYLSLGEQGLTLVTNEKQTTYQGEDFEKVLIHLFLGLNFIEMKKFDEALVETRKVNDILHKMIGEAKRPYELNAFARYLGALLYENEGEESDAYIDYKDALKIRPELQSSFPLIHVDLFRMAKKLGVSQDIDELVKKYGKKDLDLALDTLSKRDGNITLIYESGKSPRKFSSREKHTTKGQDGNLVDVFLPIAYYKTRASWIASARIEVNGQSARSAVFNDIEFTAIQQLKDRMGRAVAKALLTAAVKTSIAAGVGAATKNKDLGVLVGLALLLTSEADTRSWLLLPGQLQIAKLFLPPGKYDLKIDYLNYSGQVVKSETLPQVEVKAAKTTFIQKRTFE